MRPSQLHVLPLVLLLSTHCMQTLGCNLCLDGSTITKPDYFIGITDPFAINTCKDLSDALFFFNEDAPECRDARQLSSICGCPVAENVCSICEGLQNTPKPQQVLDGLVDIGLVTNGVTYNCALVESVIHNYATGQAECLELPFDNLRRYCGCPNEDEEESNECTFCPGGEIVPDQSGVDTFINFSNEEIVSCETAKTLAAQTEKGTEVCNQIQRVSTVCGCPVPENACRLCQNREFITSTSTMVTTPSGEHVSCESFEAQLHNFQSNSIECTSLDESYADQCGCSEAEASALCSLCVGGDAVPDPEKVIQSLDLEGARYLDYIEPFTCGALSTLALLNLESSEVCIPLRRMAHLCGCKPRAENICTLCAGGDAMSKPSQRVQFTFGAIKDSFETANLRDDNPESSCEWTESFFASLYTQDDKWCYWNQLVRGRTCGCPDNSEIVALLWMQRGSGILSLCGSLLISMSIITKPRNVKWSPYNQIVLGISFFDSLSSIAYIIGTAFGPKDIGLHGSIGNEATCGFQAWLFQIGIVSVYYSVLLSIYFLLVVKYDWTERKFTKVAKWVHLSIVTVGLSMAFAVIPFRSPDWRWCYVSIPPFADSWWPGLLFFIIPVALSILAMTVLTVVFVRHVQEVYRRTISKSMKRKGQKRGSLASRAFWQSVWFLAVFYLVWPIQIAAFVVDTVPRNYWIYVLAAIFGPLQGFLNALVVFCRDRKSIQRRAGEGIGKLMSQYSSTKSTFTGSNFFKASVEFAGGKEAKQPPEIPVTGEEADQLEIGVGKIERVQEEKVEEEEKHTLEATVNVAGNESDEASGETYEGLLEHAMNTSILTDDDRELFRASIERIENRRLIVE